MPYQHFPELLEALGRTLGLPGLKPNAEGVCLLVIDDRIHVHLTWSSHEDMLVVAIPLGQGQRGDHELLCLMLEANLGGRGTAGATIGIDAGEARMHIILQDRRPVAMLDDAYVARWLEVLINMAEKWIHFLDRRGEKSAHIPFGEHGRTDALAAFLRA
jgi:Tir chaperone protein (CesT) family